MIIKIKLTREDSKTPTRSRENDAGYDVYADADYTIKPMERQLVKTGVAISIPIGYYGHMSDRSGMALRKGAHCLGKIIDSSFRGEVGVILLNTDMYEPIKIQKGDRIAQIIFKKYESVEFEKVEDLDETDRSNNGYGSSGA
jgi:dUTP pyrophosphatase